MKLINTKVYVTITSYDVTCQFMVITLAVRDMFIGNVGRRNNVGVVTAACAAHRSTLLTFRSAYF